MQSQSLETLRILTETEENELAMYSYVSDSALYWVVILVSCFGVPELEAIHFVSGFTWSLVPYRNLAQLTDEFVARNTETLQGGGPILQTLVTALAFLSAAQAVPKPSQDKPPISTFQNFVDFSNANTLQALGIGQAINTVATTIKPGYTNALMIFFLSSLFFSR